MSASQHRLHGSSTRPFPHVSDSQFDLEKFRPADITTTVFGICVCSPISDNTIELNACEEREGHMQLPSGRAVRIAAISCSLGFAFIFLVCAWPVFVTAQDKNPQQTLAPANEPASQPSPPTTEVPGQQKPLIELDKGVVITNTDLITFTVTVTDTYGRYVSGLGKNAFTVLDEKKPQEITFFSDDDAPVSVGVIFDVSGSMSGDKIKRARDALSKFIQTSHNSDEYFLIAFNSRAQLLLDKTRDGNAVLDKLTFVQTRNGLRD